MKPKDKDLQNTLSQIPFSDLDKYVFPKEFIEKLSEEDIAQRVGIGGLAQLSTKDTEKILDHVSRTKHTDWVSSKMLIPTRDQLDEMMNKNLASRAFLGNLQDYGKILGKSIVNNEAIKRQRDIDSIFGMTGVRSAIEQSENLRKKHAEVTAISGLASKVSEFSKILNGEYKSQIAFAKSITKSIEPFLLRDTNLQKQLRNFKQPKELDTLTSYKAYEGYQEAYKNFVGSYKGEVFAKKELEETIKECTPIFNKVNEVVVEAEQKGLEPIEISALIIDLLHRLAPYIKRKNIVIFVFVMTTVFAIYCFGLEQGSHIEIGEIKTEQVIQGKKIDSLMASNKALTAKNDSLMNQNKAMKTELDSVSADEKIIKNELVEVIKNTAKPKKTAEKNVKPKKKRNRPTRRK